MNILKKFPKTFWVANTIELFERWAWYGFFLLFANYLTGSIDQGGLEFSQSEKGMIMGVGTGILYFLPVLTGALADRYGYKRMLSIAFVIYIAAFLCFPFVSSFVAVFAVYLFLALGAALFKPVISATIAKTTTDETASVGFGIFYMMVNLGAFIGPLVTLLFKDVPNAIFYISAGIIACNFVLLYFFTEPDMGKVERKDESFAKTMKEVFGNLTTIFKDVKFIIFLVIVAGFWTMYNQLFFTLPVFITQWVDTSSMFEFFSKYMPFVSANYASNGVMDAEFVTNFDAMYIIFLQVIVSSLVMKMKPLRSMMSGFLVCTIGMALTLYSQNVLFTLVAILIFALGEMAGSPKITEYIGRIAPADKKALYMGYSFIPVFIGNVIAGVISGPVYQDISDKATIVKRFAQEQGFTITDGASISGAFDEVAAQAGLTATELTNKLWDLYSPSNLWYVIFAIGMGATILLFLYDKFVMKD